MYAVILKAKPLDTGSMAIFASICPGCRERIPIDDSREKVYCMYCGLLIDVADFTNGLDAFIEGSASQSDVAAASGGKITIKGSSANATVTLFVNKKAFCKVKKEETVILDLQPGRYLMWARSGFEGSEKREFELAAGDRLEIVHNGMKGYDILKK